MRIRAIVFALVIMGCGSYGGGGSTIHPAPATPPSPAPSAPPPTFGGFATASPGSHSYVLTLVSGTPQFGYALLGPSGNISTTFPIPLAVDVRENGVLTDGVQVDFEGTNGPLGNYLGPLGLGTAVSGWASASTGVHGQASVLAQPYSLGFQYATAAVDPKLGTSNAVLFVLEGR